MAKKKSGRPGKTKKDKKERKSRARTQTDATPAGKDRSSTVIYERRGQIEIKSVDAILKPDNTFPNEVNSDGTVYVEGLFSGPVQEIWARCFVKGDPIVDPVGPNPDGYTKLDISNPPVFKGKVPAVVCSATGTDRNSTVVVWTRKDGDWVLPGVAKDFCARCEHVAPEVTAKKCLWFAYAPANYTGPANWANPESGPDYVPEAIPVPAYAKRAHIITTAHWSHDNGGSWTDADGKTGGTLRQTKQPYQDAAYNSADIVNTKAYLNELVAMVQYGTARDTPVIRIGKDAIVDVDGAAHLYIGMHDGFEWQNNRGAADCKVYWLVDDDD